MKNARLYPSFLVAAMVTVILLTAARADESETSTIKFSDPAKPGVLKVTVANGDITVHGSDAADVTVQTDLKPEDPAQRKDGLRVLTSSASYSLTERNNVVALSYGLDGGSNGGGAEFSITVPRNTAIVVACNYGGDVKVDGVSGNLEIRGLNGEVVLNDISGAALVDTMNGEINATVRQLVEGKPLSFTSINGEVAVNLPASAKANVRLRTTNGSILTDFDEKVLVTKTESVRTGSRTRSHAAPRARIAGQSATNAEVAAAVHEAVIAGAEAAREAATAIKEASIAARNAAREAAIDAEREARANRADSDEDATPIAPLPPMAPLPPVTGGKIVTGTLNGGGPEIRIVTMNGDVTLRKIDSK